MRLDMRDTFKSKSSAWTLVPEAIFKYVRDEIDDVRTELKTSKRYTSINGIRVRFDKAGPDKIQVLYVIFVRFDGSPNFLYTGEFEINERGKLAVKELATAVVATLHEGVTKDRAQICTAFDALLPQ